MLSSIAAFAPLNAPAPIDHEIEGNKKESADSADTASRARKPSFPGIPIPPPAIGAAATNAYNSAAVAANTAATTAKEYSANAAAHAATVTGWINKRFSGSSQNISLCYFLTLLTSIGFQTMMKPEEKAEDLEVGTAETAETLVESADDSKVSSTSATDASVPPSTEVIADTNTNTESEEATADDPRGSSFDTVPDESNTTTTEK